MTNNIRVEVHAHDHETLFISPSGERYCRLRHGHDANHGWPVRDWSCGHTAMEGQRAYEADGLVALVLAESSVTVDPRLPDGGYTGVVVNQKSVSPDGGTS